MIKPQIFLASQSIGRKTLLEKLSIPFQVIVSDIKEDRLNSIDIYKTLELRACKKAEDVVIKIITHNPQLTTDNFIVIAADSEAILDGKTYGKSLDKSHSKHILQALMGKTHEFATAASIIHLINNETVKQWNSITITHVTLRKLTSSELNQYLTRYDFSRFAAGYTLNETPWDLVTKIDGSYTNVIGLPFEVILPILSELKII